MGIGKGDVSHNAVLSDLDLGKGSLRQRAVYNRVGKTGGTIALSEHRGVACSPQLNSFNVTNDKQPNNTNTGYGGYFPGVASNNNYISGTTIVLSARYSGGGGGDGSSEHRTNFKVTEDGQYRVTGTCDWKGELNYYNTYWKAVIATCTRGYLQGQRDLSFEIDPGIYGEDGVFNVDQTFNLTTSRPFATLVLYAIRTGGGNASLPESVAKFSNWRVVKT